MSLHHREQAASLPDEEAALYECLSVQLDHVSAHIADEAPRRASLSRSRRLRPSHAASHTGSSPVPGHTSFVWPSRPVGSQTGGGGMAAGGSAGGAGGQEVWGVPELLAYGSTVGGPVWAVTPLMDRFVVEARVQVATSVHPKCVHQPCSSFAPCFALVARCMAWHSRLLPVLREGESLGWC